MSYVADCFDRVAKTWKLDCLRLNEKGYCSVQTEDGLKLVIDASHADDVIFYADLGPASQCDERSALAANLSDARLRLAHFCIDERRQRVNLRYFYPQCALTDGKLAAILTNFIESAKQAKSLVSGVSQPKDISTAHDPRLLRRVLPN